MFNHLFAPSQIDQAFAVWHRCGLVYLQDLFTDDGFASFKFLCDHSLPKSHYLRYLQARNFASNFFSGYPSPPPKDLLYLVLNVNPLNRRAISKIYTLILNSGPHNWDKTKVAWEGDIGETIPEDT